MIKYNNSEPKLYERKMHQNNTVINVDGHFIGNSNLTIIGGPCTIENSNQCFDIACIVKNSGCNFFRAGAFKSRTSPYTFQGLGKEGLKILSEIKKTFKFHTVSEIVDPRDIDAFYDVDILQIGARNMQNYPLLKEVGKSQKPVLLKRSKSATVNELLLSAEYILKEGNPNVILCERGVVSFDSITRNTFDLNVIPLLKNMTHLPVIADPSHATGIKELVKPIGLGAVASGADGLIVEIHNHPEMALCDGKQAIKEEEFVDLCNKAEKIHKII